MNKHFEPLRPHRFMGVDERHEFTHGTGTVCVYDLASMDFVAEIPVGQTPDCHATTIDNRYLYIACYGDRSGLYSIGLDRLRVEKVLDCGPVYAVNALPDGDTLLVHDNYGGIFVVKGVCNPERVHIYKRLDILSSNRLGDMIGGKGAVIDDGRTYLFAGWQRSKLFAMDLAKDYTVRNYLDDPTMLKHGDDLVVTPDKTVAYVACHNNRLDSYVAVINLNTRQVIGTIQTGRGTCGLTMSNDERYVVASNDADASISVIDTVTNRVVSTPTAKAGFEALGLIGYIQGISIGTNDEIYVYECAGSGALVKFEKIFGEPIWSISYPGGKSISHR